MFGTETKEKYLGIRVCNKTLESPGLDASIAYIAFPWEVGGGTVAAAISIDDIGNRSPAIVQFKGHRGVIQDIAFSPFYDTLFATTSDDATIKLWEIVPSDESTTRQDETATLTGHDKRVLHCVFNPVADWILASGSQDNTARTWNLEARTQLECIRLPEALQHIRWNYNGSLLAVTSKDKMLRILDPRTGASVAEVVCHEGAKASKVAWLGGPVSPDNLLFTAGFEKGPGREAALWDMRSIHKPLQVTPLGRGAGSVFPYWDSDTGIMLLPGKGDGNIRLFEIYNQMIHVDTEFRSTDPGVGFACVPKRGLDILENEVIRCLKVANATTIQPIEFTIPRKATEFQQDLYPPCLAGEPALTPTEWIEHINAEPIRAPLVPTPEGLSPFKPRRPSAERIPPVPPISATSAAALQKQLSRTASRLKEREASLSTRANELGSLKDKITSLTEEVMRLKDELAIALSEKAISMKRYEDIEAKAALEQQTREKTQKFLVAAERQATETAQHSDATAEERAKLRSQLKKAQTRAEEAERQQTTMQQTMKALQARKDELEDLFAACQQLVLTAARQSAAQ